MGSQLQDYYYFRKEKNQTEERLKKSRRAGYSEQELHAIAGCNVDNEAHNWPNQLRHAAKQGLREWVLSPFNIAHNKQAQHLISMAPPDTDWMTKPAAQGGGECLYMGFRDMCGEERVEQFWSNSG